MMCQACNEGRHWDCRIQNCECECAGAVSSRLPHSLDAEHQLHYQIVAYQLARVALNGAPSCWQCGAELPKEGSKCSVCGVDQIPF
jgi:hypothetical protein